MSEIMLSKSVKVQTFDGTKDKFLVFWRQYRAFGNVCKFSESMNPKAMDPALPAKAADFVTTDATQVAAMKRNDMAVAAYTLAFSTDRMMAFIDKGTTPDWPEGNAHLITKALFAKDKPEDIMSKVEMKLAINGIKMKANDDPTTLFTQITTIEVQYKTTLAMDEKLAIILSVCPKEYKPVITAEQRAKGDALTEANLEEAITQHFLSLQFGTGAIKVDDGSNDNEIGNVSLYARSLLPLL